MNAPENQEVEAGQTLRYSLPSVSDVDLDNVIFEANLGSASSFTRFSSGTFIISPRASNVGTYTVSVTLKDDNPNPLSITHNFVITVTAATDTTDTTTDDGTNSGGF
jgi:hypothetical protein